MGWTYEVTQWVCVDEQWQDEKVYGGESLLAAIAAILRARKVSGCVRFAWRG
jgi:hypothetical protein